MENAMAEMGELLSKTLLLAEQTIRNLHLGVRGSVLLLMPAPHEGWKLTFGKHQGAWVLFITTEDGSVQDLYSASVHARAYAVRGVMPLMRELFLLQSSWEQDIKKQTRLLTDLCNELDGLSPEEVRAKVFSGGKWV